MSIELIVDCENIDSVLGFQILHHSPFPWERPDYTRLVSWLEARFNQSCRATAVIRIGDGPKRAKRMKFAQALYVKKIRPVFAEQFAAVRSICDPEAPEVVDCVIDDLIETSNAQLIVYGGHDFHAARALKDQRNRKARVFSLGFPEFMSCDLISAVEDVFDIETDVAAFDRPLPRAGGDL